MKALSQNGPSPLDGQAVSTLAGMSVSQCPSLPAQTPFFFLLEAYHGGPRQALQLSGWAQEGVAGAASCSGVGEGPVLGQLDRWGRAWIFTGICPREGESGCVYPALSILLTVPLPARTLTIRTGLMASVS